jgi:hypothetical protein
MMTISSFVYYSQHDVDKGYDKTYRNPSIKLFMDVESYSPPKSYEESDKDEASIRKGVEEQIHYI